MQENQNLGTFFWVASSLSILWNLHHLGHAICGVTSATTYIVWSWFSSRKHSLILVTDRFIFACALIRDVKMGRGGVNAPQLTLFQHGGRLCPSHYYKPPGFSDFSTALLMSDVLLLLIYQPCISQKLPNLKRKILPFFCFFYVSFAIIFS